VTSSVDDFRLQSPDYYYYLNQSQTYTVDGVDDRAEFNEVIQAMNTMGFSSDEQYEIFRTVAAVLWLGNVSFSQTEKDEAVVEDPSALEMFAYLIQSDSASCQKAICTRTISTGVGGRGSVYSVPQDAAGVRPSHITSFVVFNKQILTRHNTHTYTVFECAVDVLFVDVNG
jgi:myosin-1